MDNNFYNILGIFKKLDETDQFAGQARGQKPGEQWRGTDTGTPGNKLVGASESTEMECDTNMSPLEQKLRARWEETKRTKGLTEYGMTTGGTAQPSAGASSSTSTADAEKVNQAQQNLNKLKSAGVDLPTSVGQAAKSAVSTVNNPDAATDGDSEKLLGTLGKEVERLIATGTQSQVQALATALAANK